MSQMTLTARVERIEAMLCSLTDVGVEQSETLAALLSEIKTLNVRCDETDDTVGALDVRQGATDKRVADVSTRVEKASQWATEQGKRTDAIEGALAQLAQSTAAIGTLLSKLAEREVATPAPESKPTAKPVAIPVNPKPVAQPVQQSSKPDTIPFALPAVSADDAKAAIAAGTLGALRRACDGAGLDADRKCGNSMTAALEGYIAALSRKPSSKPAAQPSPAPKAPAAPKTPAPATGESKPKGGKKWASVDRSWAPRAVWSVDGKGATAEHTAIINGKQCRIVRSDNPKMAEKGFVMLFIDGVRIPGSGFTKQAQNHAEQLCGIAAAA